MRWAGHVARTGERTGAYRVLVGKYEGKRPFGRRKRKDDIKMDLKEIGWKGVDWIDLGQEAGCCEHGAMNHWGRGDFLTSGGTFNPLRRIPLHII